VGGYFALFGLLKIMLFMYNRRSFEGSLKRRFIEKIEDSNRGDDFNKNLLEKPLLADSVDDNLVREILSYEMVMQLAIYHHKKAKEAAELLATVHELRDQVQKDASILSQRRDDSLIKYADPAGASSSDDEQ
jgi:hypothetical protein